MVYDRRRMSALAKAMLQPPLVGGGGCCLDDAEAVSALAVGAEHHSARAGILSPRLGPSSNEGSAQLHQRSERRSSPVRIYETNRGVSHLLKSRFAKLS